MADRGKTISLDYDDTFTADPDLWRAFIELATARGHHVVCITARSSDMLREVHDALPGIEVIPSNGGSKEAAADRHGLLVNIWIDDMPGIIPADY